MNEETKAVEILRQADLAAEKFYREAGIKQLRLREHQAAVLLFDRAIALNPDPKNCAAFRYRSQAYRKQRKIAECIQDLKAIPEGSSEYAYAQYVLGKLTEEQESKAYYLRAHEAYLNRVKQDPRDAVAYYRLGKIYELGLGVEQELYQAQAYYRKSVVFKSHKLKKVQQGLTAIDEKMRAPSAKLLARFDGGVVHAVSQTPPQTPTPLQKAFGNPAKNH